MPKQWSATTPGCILSGLLFHAAAILAILNVWLVIGLPYGTYRLRSADRAWSQTFLTDEQFHAKYPMRQDSPAASRLDALARRLGTYLVVTSEDRKASPDAPHLKQVREFMNAARKHTGDTARNVAPNVGGFLRSHSADLQEVEEVLLGDSPLEWKSAVGADLPVGLMGVRNIEDLLLARSLLADERADRASRDRALEASWRLEESLWRRPILIERLIAYAVAGSRNACLRRFRSPAATWKERLRRPERLTSLVDTYQFEVRAYCRSTQRFMGIADADSLMGDELPSRGAGGWLFRAASAPLLRVAVAQYADLLRVETEALQKLDPCTVEKESHRTRLELAHPRWNVVAGNVPSLLGAWWIGRDAALDDELTAQVLDEREAPSPGGPRVRRRPSSVCPSVTWASTPGRPGETVVAAEGLRVPDLQSRDPAFRYNLTNR